MELDPSPSSFMCVLGMTESSTAMGWLCKSSHGQEDFSIHNKVARFCTSNMLARSACNYSQYLSKQPNVLTDGFLRKLHAPRLRLFPVEKKKKEADLKIAAVVLTDRETSPSDIK
jgi:hypothetical protein